MINTGNFPWRLGCTCTTVHKCQNHHLAPFNFSSPLNPYPHQATWGRTHLDSPEANILPMFCDALESIHGQFQIYSKPNILQQTAQNSWRSCLRAKDTLQCLSFVRISPDEYVIYFDYKPQTPVPFFFSPLKPPRSPFCDPGQFCFCCHVTYHM